MLLNARIRRWARERERARASQATYLLDGESVAGLELNERARLKKRILGEGHVREFLKEFPAEAQVIENLIAKFLAQVNREVSQVRLDAEKSGHGSDESRLRDLIFSLTEGFLEELLESISNYREIIRLLRPMRRYLAGAWDLSNSNLEPEVFDIIEHFEKVRKNRAMIKRIADLLGRLQSAQRTHRAELVKQVGPSRSPALQHAAKSTLVGVHESADLSSILSSEAALLTSSETEKVFYLKFAEKQLQTYDFRVDDAVRTGRQHAPRRRRGPMILILDTSGSMSGAPEYEAKALALALAAIGLRQKRHIHIISFSVDSTGLTLSPSQVSLRLLLHFLTLSYHAGTDINVALDAGLRKLKEDRFQDSDLIFLTDALTDHFHEDQMRCIEEARRKGSRFYSLVIGSYDNRELMRQLDYSWRYDRSSLRDIVVDLECHPPGIAGARAIRSMANSGEKAC